MRKSVTPSPPAFPSRDHKSGGTRLKIHRCLASYQPSHKANPNPHKTKQALLSRNQLSKVTLAICRSVAPEPSEVSKPWGGLHFYFFWLGSVGRTPTEPKQKVKK